MNSSEKGVNEKGFNEMMLTGDLDMIINFQDRYSEFIKDLDKYRKNGTLKIITEEYIDRVNNFTTPIPLFKLDDFTNTKKKTLEM